MGGESEGGCGGEDCLRLKRCNEDDGMMGCINMGCIGRFSLLFFMSTSDTLIPFGLACSHLHGKIGLYIVGMAEFRSHRRGKKVHLIIMRDSLVLCIQCP